MKLSTEVGGGGGAGLVLLTHFSDIVEVLVWIKWRAWDLTLATWCLLSACNLWWEEASI